MLHVHLPVPALIDQFIAAKIAAGLSPATIRAYRQRLDRFAAWLGEQPLSRTTIRQYILTMQAEQLAPHSIAAYTRDVGVWCRWLVEEQILDTNPAANLTPKVPKRRAAYYTVEQLHKLLGVCRCTGHMANTSPVQHNASQAGNVSAFCCTQCRDRAMLIVLLDTGLRAGELTSMRRDRIDWATGHFTVVGKGNRERSAWLSAAARSSVAAYLATRRDSNPALWMGRRTPLGVSGVHQLFRRRCAQAGIRADVRRLVHACRATFAKHYIQRGGSLGDLASLLGHATLTMSAHYAELADDALAAKKAAVNPLAAILTD